MSIDDRQGLAVLYYRPGAGRNVPPARRDRLVSSIMERLIDTHCHLDFEAFADDLDDVLLRATAAGIEKVIVPAIDLDSCQAVLGLAERYDNVLAAVGVHPNSTADWRGEWVDTLRAFAGHEKVVAIGEIGLDYYRDWSPKAVQGEAFAAQLTLAAELELPVIIHNREADDDLLNQLRKMQQGSERPTGVLHSFSAAWPVASTALDLGYYLGFTGPITYKNAEEIRAVAARAPLERLLVETDGPFLAPHPHRGKRNEPAYVRFVSQRLAELKGLSIEAMARQTSANAAVLFGPRVTVIG